jgi:hypothetical protein
MQQMCLFRYNTSSDIRAGIAGLPLRRAEEILTHAVSQKIATLVRQKEKSHCNDNSSREMTWVIALSELCSDKCFPAALG